MYTFVKILKVSNKKREIKHKTSKLTEPLKLIHGSEARVPWTPDEVPLAQSPSHKRRKGRKPTAGWNHANTNSPCDRSQQTGRFSRNWGFLTWNQARGWRRMGAQQFRALGTLLGLRNMLTHSNIQQPCWKGLLPSLYQCAYRRRNPAVPLPSFLPPNCPGHLLLSWLKEIWNGAEPEGV